MPQISRLEASEWPEDTIDDNSVQNRPSRAIVRRRSMGVPEDMVSGTFHAFALWDGASIR
jgi:hypothetical protein